MYKTTVYLNTEEVEALRQLAATTGRSQAELVREAIRQMAAQAPPPPRRFRSLAKGDSTAAPANPFDSTALYQRCSGQ